MEIQVKVSEYGTEVINSRPYKYQTRQTYFADLKRLGIWDLNVSEVNSAMIRDIVKNKTREIQDQKDQEDAGANWLLLKFLDYWL